MSGVVWALLIGSRCPRASHWPAVAYDDICVGTVVAVQCFRSWHNEVLSKRRRAKKTRVRLGGLLTVQDIDLGRGMFVGSQPQFGVLSRVITRRTRVSFCVCISFRFAEQFKKNNGLSSRSVGAAHVRCWQFTMCVSLWSVEGDPACSVICYEIRDIIDLVIWAIRSQRPYEFSVYSFHSLRLQHALRVHLHQRGHTAHTNPVCVCMFLPRINIYDLVD